MKIGIIGAMPQEIALLKQELVELKTWQEAGATFFAGKYADYEIVLVESGIGKVLAALTATLLISHYHVDILMNTGSAGGIGADLKIGDVVIADRLAYHDADVTAFGYQYGQMPGMPVAYETDQALNKLALAAAQKQDLSVHVGLIVSGDQFVHSKEQIAKIKEHFPAALANEMESTAIAQVAYRYQVPFVIIRAISDNANEEAHVDFDSFIIEAGEKSAKMVQTFLNAL